MKVLTAILSILCVLATNVSAQDFFDPARLQQVEITFSQPNWDTLLDSIAKAGENYLLAQRVVINGIAFDSIGIKYKGFSSYSANRTKNPFHIELNYVKKNQDYLGYTDIKLSNGWGDPSFVREVLSYEIARKYMEASQSNYARVFVNGNFHGLYCNTEAVNKGFVRTHFSSSTGAFFKCNPKNALQGGVASLERKGTDSALYYNMYELKSDFGWGELMTLIDTLALRPSGIDKIANVDRALWMHAFNDVLVNLDSYAGAFCQNYYLYRDHHGRFNPAVWDLNMSFGSFTNLGQGAPLNLVAMQNLTPMLHATNAARPYIQKLLQNPMYSKMYLAHVRTILAENFSNNWYQTRSSELQSIIDSAVQADPNKLYTYAQFKSNLTSAVSGSAGGSTVGIYQLMVARITYLQNTNELKQIPPTLTDAASQEIQPYPNGKIRFTLRSEIGVNAYLGLRNEKKDVFVRSKMFDDGLHGDANANDGIYGIEISTTAPSVQYYFYAENVAAGIFSPQRAEHEYYAFQFSQPRIASGEIVINEFLATNTSTMKDQDGEYDDWIELYNTTGRDLSIVGAYLSDDPATPNKWHVQDSAVIPAGKYLMIWADEDGNQSGLHANFKLSSDGEMLMLRNADGSLIDSITFGKQEVDVTTGRFPNGVGPFRKLTPTFGAENRMLPTSVHHQVPTKSQITFYPNPVFDKMTIQAEKPVSSVEFFDVFGRKVSSIQHEAKTSFVIDASRIPPGVYLLRIDGSMQSAIRIVR